MMQVLTFDESNNIYFDESKFLLQTGKSFVLHLHSFSSSFLRLQLSTILRAFKCLSVEEENFHIH